MTHEQDKSILNRLFSRREFLKKAQDVSYECGRILTIGSTVGIVASCASRISKKIEFEGANEIRKDKFWREVKEEAFKSNSFTKEEIGMVGAISGLALMVTGIIIGVSQLFHEENITDSEPPNIKD